MIYQPTMEDVMGDPALQQKIQQGILILDGRTHYADDKPTNQVTPDSTPVSLPCMNLLQDKAYERGVGMPSPVQYLREFELHALGQSWRRPKWFKVLMASLDGPLLEMLLQRGMEQPVWYSQLKMYVLRAFGTRDHISALRINMQMPMQVQDTPVRWVVDKLHTAQALGLEWENELLLKEFMYDSMRMSLRRVISKHDFMNTARYNLADLVGSSISQEGSPHVDPTQSALFDSVLQGYTGGRTTPRAGPESYQPRMHQITQQEVPPEGEHNQLHAFGPNGKCYACGKTGHMSVNCPTKQPVIHAYGPQKCYRCGKTGHMASRCTSPETCFKCGQT